MPIVTPASFSPELLTTMRSALDVAVRRIDHSRPTPAITQPALVSSPQTRPAPTRQSSKAKMSALSKVEMSVSAPFWEFGGCHFDGHGGDEQARAESS